MPNAKHDAITAFYSLEFDQTEDRRFPVHGAGVISIKEIIIHIGLLVAKINRVTVFHALCDKEGNNIIIALQ